GVDRRRPGRTGDGARRAWPPRNARRGLRIPRSRGAGDQGCVLHRPARPDTAIIGSTGSGKSTLLHLIPRLYDVTGGAVLLDGVDVRDLDLDDLWSRIGLVPQKPFLFSGTVADNLRYGKADATAEEMWEALT